MSIRFRDNPKKSFCSQKIYLFWPCELHIWLTPHFIGLTSWMRGRRIQIALSQPISISPYPRFIEGEEKSSGEKRMSWHLTVVLVGWWSGTGEGAARGEWGRERVLPYLVAEERGSGSEQVEIPQLTWMVRIYLYFICMSVLSAWMSVYRVLAWCL